MRGDNCVISVIMPAGREHFGNLDVNRRIILKWKCEGVDLLRLVQDTDKWRAAVNTVTNFCVSEKSESTVTCSVTIN
jgi:hypothetical protein